jgi:hypothetical protein
VNLLEGGNIEDRWERSSSGSDPNGYAPRIFKSWRTQ